MDLTVRRGEILGIAGESGSGKSTLAVALLRLLRPPGYVAGGEIAFHPKDSPSVDLLSLDERRATVAALAQPVVPAAGFDELDEPGDAGRRPVP